MWMSKGLELAFACSSERCGSADSPKFYDCDFVSRKDGLIGGQLHHQFLYQVVM
jgi:hypothetical protein